MKRTLRIAAGLAGATVTGALAVLALLPNQLHVERSRVVAGDPNTVQHYLQHFPDRRGWVIWTELDPAADYHFTGTPGQPGATMHWVGEEIGTATLTLKEVAPGRVTSELAYEAPFQMVSQDVFELEDLGDGTTRVTWSAQGDLAFGPDRIFGVFADGILGPEYEASLDNLQALLASNPS